MRRREVIALFGSAAAWTAAARAQTAQKIPRIGILDLAPTNSEPGLRRGLRELGYIEGQNVTIEARYADGRQERLPELAAELLRLKMDIIASATTQAVQAVRRADPAIPIVMTSLAKMRKRHLVVAPEHTEHPQPDDILERVDSTVGAPAILVSPLRLEEPGCVPIPKLPGRQRRQPLYVLRAERANHVPVRQLTQISLRLRGLRVPR